MDINSLYQKMDHPSYIFDCYDLFDIENLKECVKTIVKKRENSGRLCLFLLMVASAMIYLPLVPGLNITYLYARNVFHWDDTTISLFVASFFGAQATGLLICLPIMSRRFKLNDANIGMFTILLKIVRELTLAFSTEGWMFFAASGLVILSDLGSAVARTMVTKIVSPEEQGKISAVRGAVEAGMPTIGSVTLSLIYNKTADSFPGTIYIYTASLATIPGLCFLGIYLVGRNRKNITESKLRLTEITKL